MAMQDEPTQSKQVVAGVGPDAPMSVNEAGGRQSSVLYRADLLPAKGVLEVARILKLGAEKYGKDNWRNIERASHVNHAMIHLLAWVAGDTQDEHLEHAACRLLMAIEAPESLPLPV